jgi:NAD(P)-dependent dehydrogenase (short-subunit alcohol dehydrogenase family)
MAKQLRPIAGRTVAITGGARGIGRATAAALVREGARVAIGDIDEPEARATASALGSNVVGLGLDVTDRDSFTRFLDDAAEAIGPVDVLVNNAGIMPIGPFVEEDDRVAHRQVDINVHGVILGMKLAIPRMLAQGHGHIVNVASAAGRVGVPGEVTYCGTKWAVVGMSEAIRLELAETPIDVSCVMPTLCNTELGSGITAGRLNPAAEPEDVATEIVRALRENRFEVFVPPRLKPLITGTGLLPRRARDAMARLFGTTRMMVEFDKVAREMYVNRTVGDLMSTPAATGEPATAAGGNGAEPATEKAPAKEKAKAKP